MANYPVRKRPNYIFGNKKKVNYNKSNDLAMEKSFWRILVFCLENTVNLKFRFNRLTLTPQKLSFEIYITVQYSKNFLSYLIWASSNFAELSGFVSMTVKKKKKSREVIKIIWFKVTLFPTRTIITSVPRSVRTSSIHLFVCWKLFNY
jgi:hypothetical protein